MEVKQLYELVNGATQEVIGDTAVLNEDLTNVVDVGTAVFNANALDKYVKALVNHIGKVVFVNRPYSGAAPSVMMDSWEFGSVLEKVSTGLPEATENESWELEDGQSYDQNIFYKPSVTVKFFNSMTTFEVPMSFTERQVKQSFSNPTQLNAFVSMLYTSVENSMTVKTDALIMRTINNMTAETIYSDYEENNTLGSLSAKSGVKAINLLYLYNQMKGYTGTNALTVAKALYDLDFIKFAAYHIKLTYDRMTRMSKLFNIGKQPRFTTKNYSHIVMLDTFSEAANVYLQSDTFHNEFTKLPDAESVSYWQGTGEDYAFDDVSKIDIKSSAGHTVSTTGILTVIFDRYALGVNGYDKRVTSHYNSKAEFYTNWYKQDARYFNDFNENFVVFFIA